MESEGVAQLRLHLQAAQAHEWACLLPVEADTSGARQRKRLELQAVYQVQHARIQRAENKAPAPVMAVVVAPAARLDCPAQPGHATKRAQTLSPGAAGPLPAPVPLPVGQVQPGILQSGGGSEGRSIGHARSLSSPGQVLRPAGLHSLGPGGTPAASSAQPPRLPRGQLEPAAAGSVGGNPTEAEEADEAGATPVSRQGAPAGHSGTPAAVTDSGLSAPWSNAQVTPAAAGAAACAAEAMGAGSPDRSSSQPRGSRAELRQRRQEQQRQQQQLEEEQQRRQQQVLQTGRRWREQPSVIKRMRYHGQQQGRRGRQQQQQGGGGQRQQGRSRLQFASTALPLEGQSTAPALVAHPKQEREEEEEEQQEQQQEPPPVPGGQDPVQAAGQRQPIRRPKDVQIAQHEQKQPQPPSAPRQQQPVATPALDLQGLPHDRLPGVPPQQSVEQQQQQDEESQREGRGQQQAAPANPAAPQPGSSAGVGWTLGPTPTCIREALELEEVPGSSQCLGHAEQRRRRQEGVKQQGAEQRRHVGVEQLQAVPGERLGLVGEHEEEQLPAEPEEVPPRRPPAPLPGTARRPATLPGTPPPDPLPAQTITKQHLRQDLCQQAQPAKAPAQGSLAGAWTLDPTPTCIRDAMELAVPPGWTSCLADTEHPPPLLLQQEGEECVAECQRQQQPLQQQQHSPGPPLPQQQQGEGAGDHTPANQRGAQRHQQQLFVAETPAAAAPPSSSPPRHQEAPRQQRRQPGQPQPQAHPASAEQTQQQQEQQGQGQQQLLAGLQLHLSAPVLLAVAAPDGRHLALLLSSHSLPGEPSEVLVLRVTQQQQQQGQQQGSLQQRGQQGEQQQGWQQQQQQQDQCPASAAGTASREPAGSTARPVGLAGMIELVRAVEVRRSRWGEELRLGHNSLQLSYTATGDPVLILSALLAPADQPDTSLPAIHVQAITARSGGGSCGGGGEGASTAGGVPLRGSGSGGKRLDIERREALTCVLAVPGTCELLAAGDGGAVHLLRFDPLWASCSWGLELEPAAYRGQELADIHQLLLLPPLEPPPGPSGGQERQEGGEKDEEREGGGGVDGEGGNGSDARQAGWVAAAVAAAPSRQEQLWQRRLGRQPLQRGRPGRQRQAVPGPQAQPGRRQQQLLVGLSSDGCIAVWRLPGGRLLSARLHFDYELLSLHHLPGLFRPPAGPSGPGSGLAAPLVFLSLVRSRQTERQQVAAAVLSSGGLLVLPLAPPGAPGTAGGGGGSRSSAPEQQQQQQQQPVGCTAVGRCGLVVSAGGQVLVWDVQTGAGLASLPACGGSSRGSPGGGAASSGSGGSITSMLLIPSSDASSSSSSRGAGGEENSGGAGGTHSEPATSAGGSPAVLVVTTDSGKCSLLDMAAFLPSL